MRKSLVLATIFLLGDAVNLVKGQFHPGACIPYPNYQSPSGRSFWISWRGNIFGVLSSTKLYFCFVIALYNK